MGKTSGAVAVIVACVLLAAAAIAAQTTTQISPGRGGSPHVRTTWMIHGAHLALEYGRPYLKGRPEAQEMPPGAPWRVGADEATILTSDKSLTFGAVHLTPGTYTINAQPGATWQFILGRLDKPGQWGIPYQPALEIGRTPMRLARMTTPAEQVTCTIVSTAAGATFHIQWGSVDASLAFTIG